MIYTIGEIVLDIFFKNGKAYNSSPGGSMLNCAITLGRLKTNVSLISNISNDETGNIINDFLKSNNVNTDYIGHNNITTPIALAFLDKENNATYSFYKEKELELTSTIDMPFNKKDYIAFGSFFAINNTSRSYVSSIIKKAKKAGSCILYDPNIRKRANISNEELIRVCELNISHSDIVRASDEDLYQLYPNKNWEEIYSHIVKLGCSNLIITRSNIDILLFAPNIIKSYPVPAIDPISTVGAGDNFNAGILNSLDNLHKNLSEKDYLSENEWDSLISKATKCAVATCLSNENYVPRDFI